MLVIGGARQMPGAIILAATAALRAGCGKLQIATATSIACHVAAHVPEAYVIGVSEARDGALTLATARVLRNAVADAQAVLVGPGMVGEREAAKLLRRVVDGLDKATLIIDATPLAALADDPGLLRALHGRAVVTPHSGEMAAMTGMPKGDIARAAPQIARRVANELGCIVALKGARTIVADPAGRTFCNEAGNAGLATSGSGDTLAGVVAGLAARGADPLQATAWGVYTHAPAGDHLARRVGPIGYLARELLAEVPRVLRALHRAR